MLNLISIRRISPIGICTEKFSEQTAPQTLRTGIGEFRYLL